MNRTKPQHQLRGETAISRMRHARNLSQPQAAIEAEITLPTWTAIEYGRTWPRRAVLERVARVLQRSPEDIILAVMEAAKSLSHNGHVSGAK